MKRICLLAALLIFINGLLYSQQKALPQVNITGSIIDSLTKKPVAYATINLLDTANNVVTSGYAGEGGSFALQVPIHGKFIAEITAVGYAIMQTPVVVKMSQTSVNIGQILIAMSAGDLQAVTVTVRKALVEQKPGMLVYNAENDVSNKGGTAADILRKAPVLNVDAQGNVSMRGSNNLKILIDGKYSGQMARSPADALNMMSADVVKSVEIITTPSAKYDAEGAAGVINIITKKGRKNFTAIIEASGSNYTQMINPRVSFGAGKWNFNFTGHLHRLRTREATILNRVQKDNDTTILTLNQQTEKDNAAPHSSADISIIYAADSLTEISLGIVSWVGKWPENNTNITTTNLPNQSARNTYFQQTTSANNFLGGDFNIGYDRKFKRSGQVLNILAQFSPSRDRSGYYLTQQNDMKMLLYQETNKGFTDNKEWTVQADYNQPLSASGKYSLETGFKIIKRNVSNDYAVAASEALPHVLQPQQQRTDIFKYKQNVYAGYALLKMNLKNNWYLEAGARVEKTKIYGSFKYNGNPFDNSFTNFIPTATLSKKIDEAQSINISYTKRLTRPYIWDLNPNADASDPKNIVTGNPGLSPEIAHQAEVTYGLNGGANFFINTALFWKQTNNAMIDFMATDTNGVSVTSKQNLAANKQYGLNISYSVSITQKLSINGNLNVNYLNYSSNALQIFRKGWATDADVNITWKLPKNYTLQLFGNYDTRKTTLQGYQTNNYFYNLAVKKAMPAKHVTVTASFINPFSKYIPQTNFIETPSFKSELRNQYYSREFKLTVNWEFGSAFTQKQKKKITNDDINDKGNG